MPLYTMLLACQVLSQRHAVLLLKRHSRAHRDGRCRHSACLYSRLPCWGLGRLTEDSSVHCAGRQMRPVTGPAAPVGQTAVPGSSDLDGDIGASLTETAVVAFTDVAEADGGQAEEPAASPAASTARQVSARQ